MRTRDPIYDDNPYDAPNVIWLDDYRTLETGPCECGACGHRWMGVVIEAYRHLPLECPACGSEDGRID